MEKYSPKWRLQYTIKLWKPNLWRIHQIHALTIRTHPWSAYQNSSASPIRFQLTRASHWCSTFPGLCSAASSRPPGQLRPSPRWLLRRRTCARWSRAAPAGVRWWQSPRPAPSSWINEEHESPTEQFSQETWKQPPTLINCRFRMASELIISPNLNPSFFC